MEIIHDMISHSHIRRVVRIGREDITKPESSLTDLSNQTQSKELLSIERQKMALADRHPSESVSDSGA